MNGTNQISTPPVSPPGSTEGKSFWMWILIAVAVLIVLGLTYYYVSVVSAPVEETPLAETSAEAKEISSIEQELGGISVDDLGSELGEIDSELK